MSDAEWMSHATVFTFGGKAQNMRCRIDDWPIRIEAREQRDGSLRWVIMQAGNCLRKDGDWECEPTPSSRTDDFLEMTRWQSKEEAYEAALKELHAAVQKAHIQAASKGPNG